MAVHEKLGKTILHDGLSFRIVYLRRETGFGIAEHVGKSSATNVLVRLSDDRVVRALASGEDQDKALKAAARP